MAVLFGVGPLRTAEAEIVETDVCVYGGTSAGVMAAIQVARLGKTVALVTPGQHLGGMSVEGLGGSDINNHNFHNDVAIGGLARDFYLRVGRHYGKPGPGYQFEPHVAEAVFGEMIGEVPVKVFRGARLRETNGVTKDPVSRRLIALRTENGVEFRARVYLDATIEGDLLAATGVTTVIGRESNRQYGETKNGIRATNTHAQFQVRVDPYRIPGDPKSGVIPTIRDEPYGTPGEGDGGIQGYCFRMCLTKNPANRIPFVKPENYDRGQYEIYLRYLKAGGHLWRPSAGLPNGKTDLGSWHDLSANLYGMNWEYPGGNYQTRERIYREHLTFTQGLCWFLANDPEIPASLRDAWAQWGVCRDEFQDNAGWPREFYVRDARRMVSDLVITEQYTRKNDPTVAADPVGVAYWPPDTHHVRRIVKDGAAYNEGFVFGGDDWGPFGIPYRALVPKASECTNLLTPTCPSSSHVAYGAIRIEWTFMVLGQSTGTAAVLALREHVPVQEVSYPELAAELERQGQVLHLPASTSSTGH